MAAISHGISNPLHQLQKSLKREPSIRFMEHPQVFHDFMEKAGFSKVKMHGKKTLSAFNEEGYKLEFEIHMASVQVQRISSEQSFGMTLSFHGKIVGQTEISQYAANDDDRYRNQYMDCEEALERFMPAA